MKPKTASDVAEKLFSMRGLGKVRPEDYSRLGEPGKKCYQCGTDDWWRLDEAYPWVCNVCHPRNPR